MIVVALCALPGSAGSADADGIVLYDPSGLGDEYVKAKEYSELKNFGLVSHIKLKNGETIRVKAEQIKEALEYPDLKGGQDKFLELADRIEGLGSTYRNASADLAQLADRVRQMSEEAEKRERKRKMREAKRGANTLELQNGKVYEGVTVRDVDPDGIRIFHSGGATKVKFRDLPETIREKYGYDPAKEKEFLEKQQAERKAARQAAMARKRAAAERRAEEERKAKMRAQSRVIHVEVIQVVNDGLIVFNRENGATQFIFMNPDFYDVAEDDRYSQRVVPAGTYEYTSVLGANKRIRAWRLFED